MIGWGAVAEFPSLERNPSVSVRIAEQIVSRIHSGDFPVGTRLPAETELARQFGVSRPSIREALGALQFVGYIESVRGSGTRVINRNAEQATAPVDLTATQVLRLFEARLLLEPQVAAAAARDPDLSKLALAEELIEGMGLVVHEPALHGDTDLRVHRALAEVCRNDFLVEPVRRLLDVVASPALEPTRDRAWAHRELPPIWERQHREIAQAIRARDAARAVEATWEHLASSARNALSVVAAHPDVEPSVIEGFVALLDDGPYAAATILTRRPRRAGDGPAHVRSVDE